MAHCRSYAGADSPAGLGASARMAPLKARRPHDRGQAHDKKVQLSEMWRADSSAGAAALARPICCPDGRYAMHGKRVMKKCNTFEKTIQVEYECWAVIKETDREIALVLPASASCQP